METLSPSLTQGQLALLKIMSRPLSEEDLREIKSLIVQYFANKLTRLADEVWENNQWDEAKEDEIIHTHLRTTYKKAR